MERRRIVQADAFGELGQSDPVAIARNFFHDGECTRQRLHAAARLPAANAADGGDAGLRTRPTTSCPLFALRSQGVSPRTLKRASRRRLPATLPPGIPDRRARYC